VNLEKIKKRRQGVGLRRMISLLLIIYMMMNFMSTDLFAQTASEESIVLGDDVTSIEVSENDKVADEHEFTETLSEDLEQGIEQLVVPTSFVIVMNEAELVDEINAGTSVIVLGTDIYISGPNLVIPTGANITLEGSFVLSRSNIETDSFITIEYGASLTINGVQIEAPIGATNLFGIFVNYGAKLVLMDGSIRGFKTYGSGGGVFVSGGHFEMYSGEISGNSASTGGGIYVADGSFIMWGGEISENIATDHGGGIYLVFATFDMWGGNINNNIVVDNYGGGIILDADAIMSMYDGEISGNSAIFGGGVATHGGQFTMYDGRITNNIAELGGGIYDEFFSWHPFESVIHSGEISGNTATFGGGVYIEAGADFTMIDTTIRYNAADQGGGIYLADSATVDITGESFITNNSAQSGGGIYTMDVADYNNLTSSDYQNITTASTVVFSDNHASVFYEPPVNADAYYPNIQYASSSIRVPDIYINPINNFDINYVGMAPSYLVRYFSNGGIGSHTDIRNENTVYTVLSNTVVDISRIGYNFIGWNTEADGSGISYIAGDTITVTTNIDLYAQWEASVMPPHSYTVSYFSNGGIGSYTDIRDENTVYTLLSNTAVGISRIGYNFTGWNTESDGSGVSYVAGDTITITSNVDFYAQWVPVQIPPSQPSTEPSSEPSSYPTEYSPPLVSPPSYSVESLPSRQAYLIGAEGYIHPDANITRAEVATIFFRLISDEIRMANWSRTNSYSDVTTENWFNNAVSTTTRLGIFRGRPDGTFAPNEPITRAELATAAVLFMNIVGNPNVLEDYFSDIYGHWANAYINMAATNNWVYGQYGKGGMFYPDKPITRAEAVAIINRILGRLPKSTEDLLPDMLTWPDNANADTWYYLYLQAASNSYTFETKSDGIHERWIELIPMRNWAVLEHPNSTPIRF